MKYFLTIVLLVISLSGFSQERLKPKWVTGKMPIPQNNTYVFIRSNAIGQSLDKARMQCQENMLNDQSLLNTVEVTSVETLDKTVSQQLVDGRFNEQIDVDIQSNVTIKGRPFKIQAKIIDEHWEHVKKHTNQYIVNTIYMVGVTNAPTFNFAHITSEYGIRHIWPSFIVPGAGQMVKGDWLKGGLMMGGATLFAGGIALTECTRQVYLGKISQQSRNEEAVKIYANRASNLAIGRNICIGGLCAVYIYSIIDAFVAPGARRVEVIPNGVAVNF